MKKKDLISIIVPVYNGELYIQRCLKSIIKQTYTNFEVIIIDDGSVDHTHDICTRFFYDSRIKYYYQSNQGVSAARNMGLKKAQGEWIMFIDSDDWVSPYFCELSLHAVIATNSDLGMFRYTIVDSEKISNFSRMNNKNYQSLKKKEAMNLILEDTKVGNYAWNKIYKKSLFTNYKFQIGKKFEDIGLIYKIVDEARQCVFVDYSLYYYFQRKNSLMHSVNSKGINDAFVFRYKQFMFLKKKYPDLVSKAMPDMLINSLQLIYKCHAVEFENNRKKALKIIKNCPINSNIKFKYKLIFIIAKFFYRK